MKKILLAAACTGLLFQTTSCLNTEKEMGTSRNPDRPFTPTPEGARGRVTERTILRTVNATHYFSNTKAKDNFILQLQGTKILSSRARLIILSSTGDTLRKEVMPATALLDEREADPQATTARDKEIAILQGMNAFFREDRFTQPAVPRNATQPAEVDAQAWQAVKADPKAVGFDYITNGKERRLAYAKKLQKAVIVAE
ncbi:hypothetical protein [Hymenobacter psychrotolerans]|uniref:Uncharacterized protein n=1 Tax=Hymenobacter psychrotolerans DSM 18569 TaxID=1121959 RepID=A0A1M6SS62_9BACT|nr:hypothetical protein [Hymenobacter psychrotolerans]SHK47525.1 hypothetical protein SAMN02746009_00964 [Hymenobacter psychrotolerans DSM 18569]